MPLCRVESCFKALYKQKNVIDARIYYNSIVIVDYMESEDVYEKEDNHSAVTCIFGGNQCFNGNGVQRKGKSAKTKPVSCRIKCHDICGTHEDGSHGRNRKYGYTRT